jgi:hypothetical protein
MPSVEICHLYISPGHNFLGHHGREADDYAAVEGSVIERVTGHGIRGDRFFDYKEDYKGQITLFPLEVFDELCAALKLSDCSPVKGRGGLHARILTDGILRSTAPVRAGNG